MRYGVCRDGEIGFVRYGVCRDGEIGFVEYVGIVR